VFLQSAKKETNYDTRVLEAARNTLSDFAGSGALPCCFLPQDLCAAPKTMKVPTSTI